MTWCAPHRTEPLAGRVVVPGSKSETNRSLVLAALADGPSQISGALRSRDSELMMTALTVMGSSIESCGETITVFPGSRFRGGRIDSGLAGTVLRFIPPVAMLADSPTTFSGDPQAKSRPLLPLLRSLTQLGARIDSTSLPFTLTPPKVPGERVEINASQSSQFVSGPLLAAARYPNGLHLRNTGDLPSRPHIEMTLQMLRDRGVRIDQPDDNTWMVFPGPITAADQLIAPDLTNAAVFFAAAAIIGGSVTVPHWPARTTQPGALFLQIVRRMGCSVQRNGSEVTVSSGAKLTGIDINLGAASELTPVVAALALFADGVTTISGVSHIRGHETDRLAALATEFGAAGAAISETSDGLQITGGRQLHARLFNAYADHRMAHAAALVGLRVPGTRICDIACTSKTMPTFAAEWERLCAA